MHKEGLVPKLRDAPLDFWRVDGRKFPEKEIPLDREEKQIVAPKWKKRNEIKRKKKYIPILGFSKKTAFEQI